jgi:hypothetical protein
MVALIIESSYNRNKFKALIKLLKWTFLRRQAGMQASAGYCLGMIKYVVQSIYLDGFISPYASLSIVSFVLSDKLIPTIPRADSAMFLAAFGRVGRALVPM